MNRKAQVGPVAFVFAIIFFVLFLAFAGSSILGLWGLASDQAGLTGLEAFVFNNPWLWVMIGLVLGLMGYFYLNTR